MCAVRRTRVSQRRREAVFCTGQRQEDAGRRVVNPTCSGYIGQQRFGVILWSGDVSASWDTLRMQIAEGLNLCASGSPFWTTDIGAFFVKRGLPWYWGGEYEEGNKSLAYCELYTRWFQFGCFCPIFRSHGTDIRREPWLFGEEDCGCVVHSEKNRVSRAACAGENLQGGFSGAAAAQRQLFYDTLKRANALRYRLLPYLYSCALRVWKEDFTLMRLLAFDFPGDARARECDDQFLFGDSLMVCPVLHPMYYTQGDIPMTTEKVRRVYLPRHEGGWYDFYTGGHWDGGREIVADGAGQKISYGDTMTETKKGDYAMRKTNAARRLTIIKSGISFALMLTLLAGCGKVAGSVADVEKDSSVTAGEAAGGLWDGDFWRIEDAGKEKVRFSTGLEVIYPENWQGNIVLREEGATLAFCEKANADAGIGGDLFYLCLIERIQGAVALSDWSRMLGLYKQGERQYVLVQDFPGDRQYAEDDQFLIDSYLGLSETMEDVVIKTDDMEGFTECSTDALDWVFYESDDSIKIMDTVE